jgi:hypothetical protein
MRASKAGLIQSKVTHNSVSLRAKPSALWFSQQHDFHVAMSLGLQAQADLAFFKITQAIERVRRLHDPNESRSTDDSHSTSWLRNAVYCCLLPHEQQLAKLQSALQLC